MGQILNIIPIMISPTLKHCIMKKRTTTTIILTLAWMIHFHILYLCIMATAISRILKLTWNLILMTVERIRTTTMMEVATMMGVATKIGVAMTTEMTMETTMGFVL